MDRVNRAVEVFKKGFSCSQAVLEAFSEVMGLERNTALKISQSFGGGMAHRGETCGAVTGAFMVIGLRYGRTRAEDTEAKDKTYATVHEFIQRFEAKHDSIVCKDILGYDVSKDDEFQQAVEEEIFQTTCPKLVQTAAGICEDLLEIK